MNRTLTAWTLVSAFLVGICGCVDAGGIDNSMLSRYQAAMSTRNPQKRTEGKTNLLQPEPGKSVPKLPVTSLGDDKYRIDLSLDEAIMRGLSNNLNIAVISYTPEISRQQMIQAAAAFDMVMNASVNYNNDKQHLDVDNARPSGAYLGNGRTMQSIERTQTQTYSAGVSQHTITGADWSLGWSMTRTFDDAYLGKFKTVYEPMLSLSVTQPLLKGAWSEYNMAQLNLARINRQTSVSQFRQTVEQTAVAIISAYWNLVQTRAVIEIETELLKQTTETYEKVKLREELDATKVQTKQTEAAVAVRQAALITAQKNVKDAQDSLAILLSDPQINLLTKYEIVPTSELNTTEIKISQADQLLAALMNNPQLEQARYAISSADVNVTIAENQLLPQLDLTAGTTVQGLASKNGFERANARMWDFDAVGFQVGLTMSQPVGNRAAEAALNQARLQRLQAITQMQGTADQVAQQVNEKIRLIYTAFQQIQAQAAAVSAADAQLKALEATEKYHGKLTPEFLNLKLNAQQSLASARENEITAKVYYNVAVYQLAQATGTVLQMGKINLAVPTAIGEAPWPSQPQPAAAPTSAPVIRRQ